MMATYTCGHDESRHTHTASIRRGYSCPCRRIGCTCTTYTPAPAGEAASASSRPAGAPMPTTSEPTCDTCHRLLSCVGTCPKGCPQ